MSNTSFNTVLTATSTIPTSLNRADTASRNAMLNQPLDKAMRVMGIPADEKTIAGKRVISWRIGGGSDSYDCQLRAVVDKDEIVRDISIDGRIVVCDAWLQGVR